MTQLSGNDFTALKVTFLTFGMDCSEVMENVVVHGGFVDK